MNVCYRSNGRPLDVQKWMSTGCLLDIHWTFIGLPLDVQNWMPTGCPLAVHWMSADSTASSQTKIHPKDVQWMFNRRLSWMFTSYFALIQTSTGYQLEVCGMSNGRLSWMSNGRQPKVHGMSCGCPL